MVEDFVERSRGMSPPYTSDVELDTLKSASLLHADEAGKTSPREIALWSLASIVAIILGVIPALWINRWREEPAAPRVEAAQPQAAATEDEAEPELIEMTAEPETDAPFVPGRLAPAGTKATKPHRRTERVKQPPPRARKTPPPCDVYLHPKGCPR